MLAKISTQHLSVHIMVSTRVCQQACQTCKNRARKIFTKILLDPSDSLTTQTTKLPTRQTPGLAGMNKQSLYEDFVRSTSHPTSQSGPASHPASPGSHRARWNAEHSCSDEACVTATKNGRSEEPCITTHAIPHGKLSLCLIAPCVSTDYQSTV